MEFPFCTHVEPLAQLHNFMKLYPRSPELKGHSSLNMQNPFTLCLPVLHMNTPSSTV